jgi:hypothetical protein
MRKSPFVTIHEQQAAHLGQSAALADEFDKEFACLVQNKGWVYAQHVANQIQKEFECKPTDPNWNTFTTIQFALNQLFERVRVRARKATDTVAPGQSILAEIKERDASNRNSSGRNKPTGTPADAGSGRKRARK